MRRSSSARWPRTGDAAAVAKAAISERQRGSARRAPIISFLDMSGSSITAVSARDKEQLRSRLDRVAKHIAASTGSAARSDISSASRLRRDETLAPYTTFRIGGPADLYFEPANPAQLT